MTDRQTSNPGQYKAVITSAELAKMQLGEEFVLQLTRDDHPLTEGTPYNKESVLPDELAVVLCPDIPDPTPANAFAALNARTAVESAEHPGCYYRVVDGVQEWLNPPMHMAEEYRTTERHRGLPVYTKILWARLSSAAVTIDSPSWCLVKWHGYTSLGGSLPSENPNAAWAISVHVSGNSIIFRSGDSVVENAPEAYLQVWYTK